MSLMRKPTGTSFRQAWLTKIAAVASLIILAILVGGLIGFANHGPEAEVEDHRRPAVVEAKPGAVTDKAARPAPPAAPVEAAAPEAPVEPGPPDAAAESEYRANLRNRSEAQESFARAREALTKGDCSLAEELTTRAFIRNLVTVKASRDKTGAVAESYEQAKAEALPAAEKMWAFLIEIEQTRQKNRCRADLRADTSRAGEAAELTPEAQASAICESDPVTCRCLRMYGYTMQDLLTETDMVKLEGIMGNPALLDCMADRR
jgi:hypothetical protein